MVHRTKIADFAIAHRLPSMFGWSEYCDAGGLLSYGANQRQPISRLATYADRILRGEKPADLPVFQPTRFELVVNLRPLRTRPRPGQILHPVSRQSGDRMRPARLILVRNHCYRTSLP